MKLLFDNNLSPHLVWHVRDIFPDASHVGVVSLDRALDVDVWLFAREHGYVVVTKDADFSDLSQRLGSPPKLIWLRIGNCTTAQIAELLREHASIIAEFLANADDTILILVGH